MCGGDGVVVVAVMLSGKVHGGQGGVIKSKERRALGLSILISVRLRLYPPPKKSYTPSPVLREREKKRVYGYQALEYRSTRILLVMSEGWSCDTNGIKTNGRLMP